MPAPGPLNLFRLTFGPVLRRAAPLSLETGRFLEEADPMKLITAIVKPDVTDDLVPAVAAAGARGLTATEVIGFGQQYGRGGAVSPASSAALLPKVRIDIVVPDDIADDVVRAIAKCADTGTIGDGKIWVSPVDSVLRVRTGERDNSAI